MVTSLGLAWKAGIAAEVLCTPKGAIGTQLYNAKIYIETTDLFAWTFVVVILSLLLEFAFVRLTRRFSLRIPLKARTKKKNRPNRFLRFLHCRRLPNILGNGWFWIIFRFRFRRGV